MLPTSTMGSAIEGLHWWGHQRHKGDVHYPRFDIPRAHVYLVRQTLFGFHREASTVPKSDRPLEHQVMILFGKRMKPALNPIEYTPTALYLCKGDITARRRRAFVQPQR